MNLALLEPSTASFLKVASLAGTYNYALYVVLMMIGFYGVIAKKNLIKQALGLGLFSTGIFLFYISMGVVEGGTAPVWWTTDEAHLLKAAGPYDNPLTHVLILTAIVVSVSTLAVAMALIVNIQRAYGTIEEDEIRAIEDAEHPGEGVI
ncbi:MAG: cation:proton antiporter subunit C [Planctomycetota bacterium]|nr:cation:proton antiporter subunit C [Planctomycetota bacterium]